MKKKLDNDYDFPEINKNSEDLIVSKEFLIFLKWFFLKNKEKDIKKIIFNSWNNGLKEFYFKEKNIDEDGISLLINDSIINYINIINELILYLIESEKLDNNDLKILSDNNLSDNKKSKSKKKNKKDHSYKSNFIKNWNPPKNTPIY